MICTVVGEGRICSGQVVIGVVYPKLQFKFLIYSAICFFSSLIMCLILVSGIRFEHKLFMWLLSLVMWTILSSFAFSYVISLNMLTPGFLQLDTYGRSFRVIDKLMLVWICVLIFIVTCHASSIITWIVTYLRKKMKEKRI